MNWGCNSAAYKTLVRINKSAFADDSLVTHLNYDTYLGESLTKKVRRGVQEIFMMKSTSSYLIEVKQLDKVINNLKIGEEFIMICFGTQNQAIQFEKLILPSSGVHNRSIYILRKTDMPFLVFKEVPASQQELYGLERISEEYNIYASVTDLYQNEKVKEEVLNEAKETDLDKKVLLNVSINMEFKWKDNSKCVELRLAERTQEKGILDDINNIHPFDD
ncbi:MAG TPA: hypothetical protein VGP55_04985 [Chitinophagaceae bacterium]|nr:hypothetical protein [Chitinophagaceae bacterium]